MSDHEPPHMSLTFLRTKSIYESSLNSDAPKYHVFTVTFIQHSLVPALSWVIPTPWHPLNVKKKYKCVKKVHYILRTRSNLKFSFCHLVANHVKTRLCLWHLEESLHVRHRPRSGLGLWVRPKNFVLEIELAGGPVYKA